MNSPYSLLLSLSLFACWIPSMTKAAPAGTRETRVGNYAIKSGNIDDPIWVQMKSDGTLPRAVESKVRPKSGEDISLGINKISLTISIPIEAASYQQRGDKNQTFIKDGGSLKVLAFIGQRGQKPMSGTYSMTGGSLEVKDLFFLAGNSVNEDGTCAFNQSGGTVSVIDRALNVTSPFTLTGSPNAVAVYNFSGGTIHLLAESTIPDRVGIRKGVGNGTFNWTGGVLNAKRLSEGLTNKGGRLSPGGEGEIGETILVSDTPQTYVQEAKGVFSVDIGGRSRFDRLVWKDKSGGSVVKLDSGTVIAVNLHKGYKPGEGATFPIISADRIEGGDHLVFEGPAARDFAYELIPAGPKAGLTLVYAPGKGGQRLQK